MDYKYSLQPYRGKSSRFRCPQCGDLHSLSLYVDCWGNPIAPNVGRCNHETGCGYNYTPSEYFKDNPQQIGGYLPQWKHNQPISMKRPLCLLPYNYVSIYQDTLLESDFARFLLKRFPEDKVKMAFFLYLMGAYNGGRSIFWQVDKDNQIRTGKIIQFDPETGHRLHADDPRLIDKVEVNWVHSLAKKKGIIPYDWELSQCLFGEHLLRIEDCGDQRPIAIVEGEKTAVIASIAFPDFLWLSCGGLRNFTEDKMKVLKGRVVYLFPDQDGFSHWQDVKNRLSKYAKYVAISDILNDGNPDHYKWDIADLIIDAIDNPQGEKEQILKEMVSDNPDLGELIEKFDLVIVD